MGPTRAFLLAVVMLLGGLAGCAAKEEDAGPKVLGDSYQFGAGTSVIRGVVLDTELQPVPEALVRLNEFDPQLVDIAGTFEASGLQPGTYQVQVTAPGHAVGNAIVQLDEAHVLEIKVTLERIASRVPYTEILFFKGYSICDQPYYVNFQNQSLCNQQFGGGRKNNIFPVNVSASWRFVVSEVTWRPNVGDGTDAMRLVHGPQDSCSGGAGKQGRYSSNFCYGLINGEQYLKMEGEPGKTIVDLYYDPWEDGRFLPYPPEQHTMYVMAQWTGWGRTVVGPTCREWVVFTQYADHKPGCYGVGISTGFPVDVYVSLFHWAKPPMPNACCPVTEYSAVMDQ